MVIPRHRSLEFRVLEALWARGASSMREIQDSLPEAHRPSYETVRSIVYRLQAKKVIRRVKKISKSQIFEAVAPRDNVRQQLIDEFADLFAGDMRPVIARLASTGRLTLDDLQAAQALIEGNAAG